MVQLKNDRVWRKEMLWRTPPHFLMMWWKMEGGDGMNGGDLREVKGESAFSQQSKSVVKTGGALLDELQENGMDALKYKFWIGCIYFTFGYGEMNLLNYKHGCK
ncbi:hypothetical protein CMV_025012 [Castanea mollissima]|uniref:Uncharacterized protein n=1 Tax=Castanea mollissima TaxID=60419 RepID=A0A8J4VHA1_9ROSI|nr:hypothetical protein CMV_025012 [Castanea mollissima]